MEGTLSSWGRLARPLAVVAIALLVAASGIILVNQLLQGPATGGTGPGPTENMPPVVQVWVPNGGEDWTGGSVHSVWWTMSDDADLQLFVHLYYTPDAGLTWSFIGSGSMTNGSWPWTVPSIDTTDALVRVCATDSGNLTTCDDSDAVFAIDSTKPYLVASSPADGATDVARDAPLIAQFSEPMNVRSSEGAFFIQPAVGGIAFTWSDGSSILTVTHALFEPNTTYTWGFSCEASDASAPGNPLRDCPWSSRFRTGGGGSGNGTLPDLTLSPEDITFSPPDPVYGDLVTISATIHNVGTADASNVTVMFTDPAHCLLDVVTVIGYDTLPSIAAGGSGVASVVWDTTTSADGRDVIVVGSDPNGEITELDEWNNGASRFVYVRGTPCEGNRTGPDLTLSSQDIYFSDDTPDVGQTISITGYIYNIGDQDAHNVTVRFVDWCCERLEPTVIGEQFIPYIPAGSIRNATVVWIAGPAGLHTIGVIADPYDTIRESDEGNNSALRDIVVGGGQVGGIFVQAWTFDNDNDGRYDDVVILVYDGAGHAVEGASVWIDGAFYGLTPDTGLLVAYNFPFGDHVVLAVLGTDSARVTFHSDG